MKPSMSDVGGAQDSSDDVQEEPTGIALAALDGLTLAEAFQRFVLDNEMLQDKAQALGEAFPALRPWLGDFLAGKLPERIQLDATGRDTVERGFARRPAGGTRWRCGRRRSARAFLGCQRALGRAALEPHRPG